MGMNIDAKLILGYTYAQLTGWANENDEDVDDLIDLDELDYASPYYDSPRAEWVIGTSVSPWGREVADYHGVLDRARFELMKRFGIEPKLYVSAHVT